MTYTGTCSPYSIYDVPYIFHRAKYICMIVHDYKLQVRALYKRMIWWYDSSDLSFAFIHICMLRKCSLQCHNSFLVGVATPAAFTMQTWNQLVDISGSSSPCRKFKNWIQGRPERQFKGPDSVENLMRLPQGVERTQQFFQNKAAARTR